MTPGRLFADRRFVAGVVLVVAAVLGAVVFRTADASRTEIVVASRDLPAGSTLQPGDLAVTSISADDAVLRNLVRGEERSSLPGTITRRRLTAGEVVRSDDVSESGPSRREVSVPVAADHVPAGRVGPGDRVDILATYGEGAEARTVVVARAVEVVALTQQDALLAGTSGAVSAVTVAVDSRTASLLVFAARSATVDIVRAVGEDTGPETVTRDDLGAAG